jgi:hypothetical protein
VVLLPARSEWEHSDTGGVDVGVYEMSEIGDAEEPEGVADPGEPGVITESRDVGASNRKLQLRLFLSQFAQDGCLTSHYFLW